MSAEAIPEKLEYFISEKGPFLVVSLNGTIAKNTTPVLDECREKITQANTKKVILSLHDVSRIDLNGLPALAQLQQAVRSKPATLRLCFIKKDVAQTLFDKAIVRKDEVTMDLKEALESLKDAP